jgi:glycosyltransferase involved in cell wall biosynthesis
VRPLLVPNRGYVLGGGEVGVELLVDGLLARGVEPRVVLPTPGSLLADARVDRRVASASELADELRRAAEDRTVVHTWSVGAFAAVRDAQVGLPVVLHALVPDPTGLDARVVDEADAIVCNSGATATRFGSAPQVRVLHNGVPEPRPVPAAERITDPELRSIAIVGNVCPRKGQLDALGPLGELTRRRGDVEVLLIGRASGPFGHVVRTRAAEYDRIRLVGSVPRAGDHLLDIDLVLVPSRSEGFGRVAAEALRAGTPVLARPVDGLLEVLDELDDPWLPAADRWSDRIEAELDHPTHGAAELRRFGERFAVDPFVDGIVDVYRDLSAGAAG